MADDPVLPVNPQTEAELIAALNAIEPLLEAAATSIDITSPAGGVKASQEFDHWLELRAIWQLRLDKITGFGGSMNNIQLTRNDFKYHRSWSR